MKKQILKSVLSAVVMMMAMTTQAQVSFYIEDFNFDEGEYEKEVAICMKNEPSNITGVQMDIYMPEGLSILSDEIGYYIDFGSRTTSRKHTLESALQRDGAVRVISASAKLLPFTGNDGDIFIITVVADKNFRSGTIELKNCVATGANTDGSNIVQYKPADYSATVMDYLTGVEETLADVDANAEYYNLQGVKVAKENLTQGVYIKKVAGKSVKVLIK